jgi:FkbM family methyltransferase
MSSIWIRRLRNLWINPATVLRKCCRRVVLWLPHRPIQTISLGRVRLELDLRDENMRNMFLEWYETEEVALLRRMLRPGQIVLDVGANIGYLTAVAAEAVGPTGQVHSFEPAPPYFQRLRRLAELNGKIRIFPVNIAAGSEENRLWLSLSNDRNIGWNTLVSDFMPPNQLQERIQVQVRPLDAYISETALEMVHFIKIDAEGFEFPVLRGLRQCLCHHRPSVLCEVVPTAYPLLQCSLRDLQDFLKNVRYEACDLYLQPLDLQILERTTNVLLIPEEKMLG